MARPLDYRPEPTPPDAATADLERLLETLHQRGALRLLNALVGGLPGVAEPLLGQLDTPVGRNLLVNLTALGRGLGEIDSDAFHEVMEGVGKGLTAARASLDEEPPGLIGLTGELSNRDVRRGLHAVLTLLATLGRHLHEQADLRAQADLREQALERGRG